MTTDSKHLNRKQFGTHADNFVTSTIHAKGYSLGKLVEVAAPQPDWRVLDVATGGGHTALAFAQHATHVVASDLTYGMLIAARRHISTQEASNIAFCQAEAEHLPFPDAAFDCVTCRIAPHHFPDAAAFVREAARVLVSGGVLAVADNIVSGEPKVARFADTLDRLRDPSHHQAYSLDDWAAFYFAAGIEVTFSTAFQKEADLDEWAARVVVQGDDLVRLRVLLTQAPAGVREWFSPRQVGTRLVFQITEAIVAGRRL